MTGTEVRTHDQAPSAAPLRVAIVTGSTRPGRRSDTVARWVYDLAAQRDDATFEVVDIAEHGLPLLDEPVPPLFGRYSRPHTQKWAARIGSFDAFVFVTPEYNRSTSGALKNAIDFLYAEWNDKAAGFVGYGSTGGSRAVEHLRLVLAELKVASVRTSVTLMFGVDFRPDLTVFTPRDGQEAAVATMLEELVAWAGALRAVREPASPA
jgi:NAD(P)H-dependent FMN reductase